MGLRKAFISPWGYGEELEMYRDPNFFSEGI